MVTTVAIQTSPERAKSYLVRRTAGAAEFAAECLQGAHLVIATRLQACSWNDFEHRNFPIAVQDTIDGRLP